MRFKNYIKLLPLTVVPDTCSSIMDWMPFENGDPIDEIVERYHRKCIDYFTHDLDWLTEDMEREAVGIDVVLNDLKSINVLEQYVYQQIKIMMLDLKCLSYLSEVVDTMRPRMARTRKSIFMPQICSEKDMPGAHSHLSLFAKMMVYPSEPEIIYDQQTFEQWMENFYRGYGRAVVETKAVLAGEGRGAFNTKRLVAMAEEIRDVAIVKKINDADYKTLAAYAVKQEVALGEIGKKFQAQRPVDLAPITQDLMEVDLEMQDVGLQMTPLLHVSLTVPVTQLSEKQMGHARALGISCEGAASIVRDAPASVNLIGKMGSNIKASRFVADLVSSSKTDVKV